MSDRARSLSLRDRTSNLGQNHRPLLHLRKPVMSDHATFDAPSTTETELHFSSQDLKGFDADDVEAGRNICKMLSLFFFYTVIVMGLSTLTTLYWINATP